MTNDHEDEDLLGWKKCLLYDLVLWMFGVVFDLFFREIDSRGGHRVPKHGPVIFVAAPHANQFVDPMLLMLQCRSESKRRISFLVAEKSLKRRFIGAMARATQAIGVARAQDNLKPAHGEIYVDDPSALDTACETDNDHKLVIRGRGTQFTKQCMVNGLLGLPQSAGTAEIAEIRSDTELVLRKEFKKPKARELLATGTGFQTADHVNQSDMYHRVFSHLARNGSIGIFPEGGSHDRPNLLPLKAGVAIMALGALAEYPDLNLQIVPCGMNYFHAHKFRSRLVIEYGKPLKIPPELVHKYKLGGTHKREAVGDLLKVITDSLSTVTVVCPDYETMVTVQTARKLYQPSRRIPLPLIVEFNRRVLDAYMHLKDDERIVRFKQEVAVYNKQLQGLGIKDHQVEYVTNLSLWIVIRGLVFRTCKLVVLFIGSLPGTVLFSPVFVATKVISRCKAQEALRGSVVKIAARDVISTWKVLVAMGLSPLLYICYAAAVTWYASSHDYVSSFADKLALTLAMYVLLACISYAALVIGDSGMDIFKSLRPLVLVLLPWHKSQLESLKARRRSLVLQVTELVNSVGPELYDDFDVFAKAGHEPDQQQQKQQQQQHTDLSPPPHDKLDMDTDKTRSDTQSETSNALSRVNSESSLANIPLFSNLPSSPTSASHSSRSSVSGDECPVQGSTSSANPQKFQTQVSQRIRAALDAQRSHTDD